jgi:2-haloacid dehalogenase
MSSATKKHVVFDVVGTCVSYDAFFQGVEDNLGPQLSTVGISSKAFGYAWMQAAELEFTFLSISSRHTPYLRVFSTLFYRILAQCGVPNPRAFATDEQRDAVVRTYSELELRPALRECFSLLRENGFTVWCLTTGDVQRVRGYFLRAGVEMPVENFMSCDASGVAKPALKSYEPALNHFGEGDVKWFAAAHMWDVSAAKVVG